MAEKKKKKKGKIILILSIILIGAGGLGTGTFFIVKKFTTPKDVTIADIVYAEDGDGYKVTGINNADPSKITKIEVPNKHNNRQVKSIDKGAFKGCSSVVNITLPFIGQSNDASYGDNALFGWVFGDEMFSGAGAFTWQCYLDNKNEQKFAKYVIPYTIQNITISGANHVAPGAFSNCRYVESINLKDCNANTIGNYAFNCCYCLYNFTIPSSITKIEKQAFEKCLTLQSVTIPDGVTEIGEKAFSECYSSIKTIVPASVNNMGSGAFHSVNNGLILTKADKETCGWPSDWVDANANVVYNYNNEGFYYKDNCHVALCGEGDNKYLYLIQWIGDWARATIDIPDTLNINGQDYPIKVLGATMLTGNVNVITINIGSNVETISTSCFEGCTQLTTINIPNKLKNIGKAAFKSCTSLNYSNNNALTEGINFNNVENIGDEAFMNCTSLTNINFINSKIKTIGASAFENNIRLKSLTLPSSLKTLGERAFFGSFKIDDSATTTTYPTIEFEANTNLTTIPKYCFSNCGNRSGSASYPRLVRVDVSLDNLSNLTKIDDYSFNECYMRNYIASYDNLEVIGDYAFYNSKMVTEDGDLKIPSKVNTIGKYAFRYCNNFSGITFEEGGNIELTIGDYAFSDCANINFTSLVLPDRIVKLGDSSFRYCSNLQQLKLPKNEKLIELPNYVFSGCTYVNYSDSSDKAKGLVLPLNITKIGHYAFSSCSNIENITCENDMKLTYVGNAAFSGCTLLTSTNLDFSHLETMGTYIFNGCAKLVNPPVYKKIDQTTTITTLPAYMYANNTALVGDSEKGIELDSCITKIDSNCFYNCSNLDLVTINGTNINTIATSAFQNCAKLNFSKKITPTTVSELGFGDCKALTSNDIDLINCSTIGTRAFENCTIAEISLRKNGTSLSSGSNITMGVTPFVGWTSSQTIKFNKYNFANNSFDSTAAKVTTRWGWELIKDNSGTFYTCAASGSNNVRFVYENIA